MKAKFQYAFLLLISVISACKSDSTDSIPLAQVDYYPFTDTNTGYVGFFDSNGEIVLKNEFAPGTTVAPGTGRYLWVKEKNEWQLYDIENPNTPPISIPKANVVTPFEDGLSLMQAGDDPICILNDRLETVFRFPHDVTRVERIADRLFSACVMTPDSISYTLYDSSGRIKYGATSSPIYGGSEDIILVYSSVADSDAVSERLAIVDLLSPSSPVGMIDLNEFTPCAYDFHSGMIAVADSQGELTYLDKSGKPCFSVPGSVITDSNDEIDYSFYGGYAIFKDKNEMFGIIDSEGNIKVRPKFSNLVNLGNGRFAASKGESMTLVDHDGKELSDRSFTDCVPFVIGDNYMFAKGDMISIIDKDGKVVKDITFNRSPVEFEKEVTLSPILPAIEYLIDILRQLNPGTQVENYARIFSADPPSDFADKSDMLTNTGESWSLTFLIEAKFNGPIVEPITRQVTENDGWFESTRTVIDGYRWSDVGLSFWKVSVNLSGTEVAPATFAERFVDALKKVGYQRRGSEGMQYSLSFPEYPHVEMVAVISPLHHTVEITLSAESDVH